MDVIKWQKGLEHCLNNAIQLRDDGELLMEKGSFGHSYFSFYTALEELGLGFFILQNFHNPNPEKLNKLIYSRNSHKKKSKLMIFDSFAPYIKNLNLPADHLKEVLSKGEAFCKGQALEEFYARKLDEGFNIWENRNKGIYVSLNKDNTEWDTPKKFTQKDVELIHEAVNKRIEEFNNALDGMERLKRIIKRK